MAGATGPSFGLGCFSAVLSIRSNQVWLSFYSVHDCSIHISGKIRVSVWFAVLALLVRSVFGSVHFKGSNVRFCSSTVQFSVQFTALVQCYV